MTSLQLYRGDSLVINEHISVLQPSLGEIADFGEERYFRAVQAVCGTPSDYIAPLADIGMDFEQITEFQLFILLHGQLTKEDTRPLLGELDLSSYKIAQGEQDKEMFLVNDQDGSIIDRAIYSEIANHVRRLHNMKKNVIKAGNAETKKYLIERDRKRLHRLQRKPFESVLFPLISAMCNCEQFKYNQQTVWDISIFAFYDSIKRIQKIKDASSLLSGIYAGTVDAKKIPQESLNWMGNINEGT